MDHDHHHAAPDIPAGAETVKDPVCRMTVAVKPNTRDAEFQGETFHFCSEKCQATFKADPSSYASDHPERTDKATPANAQYTCPMHPEITQSDQRDLTARAAIAACWEGNYPTLWPFDRVRYLCQAFISRPYGDNFNLAQPCRVSETGDRKDGPCG
ncbi:MAG: YHS domain-containing protein [Roseovarius sp.]|jgi:YHS domain-containing protein|nr:YHS domain-containing protein [Roseovarius sp.]